MPTIRFPKTALKEYLAADVSDEQLKEAISMIGTDLESFGDEVVVEIFPDRPDLLSPVGLARSLNHFLELKKEPDTYRTIDGENEVRILSTAKNVRPHTRCAIIRDITLTDEKVKEIIEIQEKLHVTFGRNRKKVAIGLYPLDKISFPVTFGAEKAEDIVFQPLESTKEMNARQMLEQHPTGKKYAPLLKGYDTLPVFRDSNGNVLSVPPVINSHDTGRVVLSTTDMFLECSGHEEKPLEEAVRMICCALADMGAKIETVRVVYDDRAKVGPNLRPYTMDVDLSYLSSRAGIPKEALERSLSRCGLTLQKNTVTIPSYRVDFSHQVDVVEEAAIGYGYQNIVAKVPNLYTAGNLQKSTIRDNVIRSVLSGSGLFEVMNFAIRKEGVELANPLTEEYTCLRSELLSSLLDTLGKNLSNPYPQRVFELGVTFFSDDSYETRVREEEHLSAMLCGEDADYTRIRQVFESLSHALEWDISIEEFDDERFIPGRCARVSGDVSGVIGEVHPEQLVQRGILFPAAAFEVNLE